MKRMLTSLAALLMALLLCAPALAETAASTGVQRSPYLDAAFVMLEKDNIFLQRYNEMTGAGLEAYFELGVPYFFGGKYAHYDAGGPRQLSRRPDYFKRECWEDAGYYVKGKQYLYGFDCSGYVDWIVVQSGLKSLPSLQQMITTHRFIKTHHVFNHRVGGGKELPPYDQQHLSLQVGDMLAAKRMGGRHVLMYIGTLRDYGFTAEEEPLLAPYLDYPLAIHCGANFVYTERTKAYLASQAGNAYYRDVLPSDGGVTVSILGVPRGEAPCRGVFNDVTFEWFELACGYKLTLWDLSTATSFCWYRPAGL